MARVPKLMQNASFVCVVVGAFSHIFLQIFNSIQLFFAFHYQGTHILLFSLKEQLGRGEAWQDAIAQRPITRVSRQAPVLACSDWKADISEQPWQERTDARTDAELKVSKGRPGET